MLLDIIGKLFLLEGGAGALLLLSIHAGCPGHLVSLLGCPFGSRPTLSWFIVLLGCLGYGQAWILVTMRVQVAGGGRCGLPPVGAWRSFCSSPLLAPPCLCPWYLLSCLAKPTLEGCRHLQDLRLPAALVSQGRCLAGLLSGPPGGFGVFFGYSA